MSFHQARVNARYHYYHLKNDKKNMMQCVNDDITLYYNTGHTDQYRSIVYTHLSVLCTKEDS